MVDEELTIWNTHEFYSALTSWDEIKQKKIEGNIIFSQYRTGEQKPHTQKTIFRGKTIIAHCVFLGELLFDRDSNVGEITFHDCIFRKKVSWNHYEQQKSFSFYDCNFKHDIHSNYSKMDNLRFDKCVAQNIELNSTSTEFLGFLNSRVGVKVSKYNSIVITEKCGVRNLSVQAIEIEKLQISCSFDMLSIHSIKAESVVFESYSGNIHIDGSTRPCLAVSHINDLIFPEQYQVRKDTKLLIDGITINNLSLKDVANLGSIIFRNLIFKGLVDLSKISGEVHFNNVNLEKSSLQLLDSDLSEIVFSTVTWPKDYLLRDHKSNGVELEKLRDTYRQLKWINKNQSNNLDSMNFYSNEMRIYWRIMRKKPWKGNIQDKILLWTSRCSSNFGQSIFLPVPWLVFGHMALFLCLMKTDALSVGFSNTMDWEAFRDGVGLYFKFLIPTHRFDVDDKFANAYALDFFIRVWSGYFIFHIIKASRKFTD